MLFVNNHFSFLLASLRWPMPHSVVSVVLTFHSSSLPTTLLFFSVLCHPFPKLSEVSVNITPIREQFSQLEKQLQVFKAELVGCFWVQADQDIDFRFN